MVQEKQNGNGTGKKSGAADLRQSPMMAHLLEALELGADGGHYGRLLAKQPDHGEGNVPALLAQVKAEDDNPPKRERILEWRRQQEFAIIPDAENPDSGNLYRELQFPDGVYEHIQEYYEEKVEAQAA